MFQSFNAFLEQANDLVSEPPASETEPSTTADSTDSAPAEDYANALEETLKTYFGDADETADSVSAEDTDGVALELDTNDGETDWVADEEELEAASESDDVQVHDTVESDSDTDLDGLWDDLLDDLVSGEQSEDASRAKEPPSDELAKVKQTLESLVSWQTAIQQYLQTSVEAENIRQVAQQLASLGVILPDEQIQEIARLSQQLNIPPSVLLKAKAYDYTMQQIQQDNRAPYPFMNPSRPPVPNILPSARPFQETTNNAQKPIGFTSFREFLKQMGITEE